MKKKEARKNSDTNLTAKCQSATRTTLVEPSRAATNCMEKKRPFNGRIFAAHCRLPHSQKVQDRWWRRQSPQLTLLQIIKKTKQLVYIIYKSKD